MWRSDDSTQCWPSRRSACSLVDNAPSLGFPLSYFLVPPSRASESERKLAALVLRGERRPSDLRRPTRSGARTAAHFQTARTSSRPSAGLRRRPSMLAELPKSEVDGLGTPRRPDPRPACARCPCSEELDSCLFAFELERVQVASESPSQSPALDRARLSGRGPSGSSFSTRRRLRSRSRCCCDSKKLVSIAEARERRGLLYRPDETLLPQPRAQLCPAKVEAVERERRGKGDAR